MRLFEAIIETNHRVPADAEPAGSPPAAVAVAALPIGVLAARRLANYD